MSVLNTAVDNAGRVALLSLPVVAGIALARWRINDNLSAAIAGMNQYSLYLGFPALLLSGILASTGEVPRSLTFWLLMPCTALLFAALSRVLSPHTRGAGGALALVLLFGNTAYLGIPLAVAALGEEIRTEASLLVGIQVMIAVSAGPWLLLRWSGKAPASEALAEASRTGKPLPEPSLTNSPLRGFLRQPLFWAPVVGFLARLLPDLPRDLLNKAATPFAVSAAPVALFTLGLYLYQQRRLLRTGDFSVWTLVATRLVLAPLLVAGLARVAQLVGILDRPVAQIAVLLAAMPAAVTTFSLAQEADTEVTRVASVIVRSSAIATLTLPVVATLVLNWPTA